MPTADEVIAWATDAVRRFEAFGPVTDPAVATFELATAGEFSLFRFSAICHTVTSVNSGWRGPGNNRRCDDCDQAAGSR